jgi:haloalkane dehalogenase
MIWDKKPTSMVQVKGGALAYYRTGRGPDLVLVHGWPLHAATFRHLARRLAADFTLHMFDLPGTGSSVWSGPLSFQASAAALGSALESLGLERYVLFGHDSGGAIARHVAANNARVQGLVLEDTEIPGHRSALLMVLLGACRLPLADRVLPWALQRGAFRRSMLGFGSCFEDPAYADSDFAELFVTPLRERRVAEGQMALARSFDLAFVDELHAVHAKLRAPTLCIWGEHDPYFPVEAARAMLPELPARTQLAVIPGARLFPHEDHPDEVAALVRAFHAELAPQPLVVA